MQPSPAECLSVGFARLTSRWVTRDRAYGGNTERSGTWKAGQPQERPRECHGLVARRQSAASTTAGSTTVGNMTSSRPEPLRVDTTLRGF